MGPPDGGLIACVYRGFPAPLLHAWGFGEKEKPGAIKH